ncbi:MAG: hypothetical protein HC769_05725 [Cyanobacteria bacterium CRU_2_1]|nr:hypothetical protein [Cyanobacteria bacterium RU_5_0]NJR58390.1 hypothetical protein [Cyanobacteria bacterium CRU_2_1]
MPRQAAEESLEELRSLQSQGNYQECISQAQAFPSLFSDLLDTARAIEAACSRANDENTLQRAVDIASQPNADLQKAIDTAATVSSNSPVYEDSQNRILQWQKIILQGYLTNDVPKQFPEDFANLPMLQPTVEQITAEQVTISYDTSGNPRRATEDGIRTYTTVFMELLRGNGEMIEPKYVGFTRLVVYPRQGNQQGILSADDWQTYLDGKVSAATSKIQLADQLRSQIQIADR